MRMNRYLASTLLAGLFVTATFFSPAMGQEQSLQPEGAWSITKIDRASQGGNSYCTLSRKYSNGAVLSLGRNQTEEYSLAIDFQKPVFEKDKALKINLQPGPGQIRAYDMMPTSEKAVVIRLGWDTGFFDALNQSQQMKVKIADKGYTFATPEISKGQTDLQGCMEELQSAGKEDGGNSKAAQTKDVLDAVPVKTSNDFTAGRMDEKIASSETLAKQKEQVAAQEKKIVQDFAQSMEAQEEKATGKKSKNFTAHTAKVDDSIKVANVEPAAGDKIEPELVKRPAMATVPAVSDKAKKEMEAMKARLDRMASENETLKQNSGKMTPEAKKQVEAVIAEKESLQTKIDKLQREKDAMPAPQELAAIQTKAKALETEKAALETNLQKIQEQSKQANEQSQQVASKKMTDLQMKLSSIQKINTELSKQLETAQAEKMAMIEPAAEAEKTAQQAQSLQQKLGTVSSENEKLKQQAAAAVEAQKQVALVQARAKELEEKNAQLAESARQAQLQASQAVAKTGTEAAQKAAALEAELAAKAKASAEATQKAAALEVQLATNAKSSTETAQKAAALEAELAATKKESVSLKQQLDGMTEASKMAMAQPIPAPIVSEDEYNKLQKQLSDLTSENEILKQKTAAAPATDPKAQTAELTKQATAFEAQKKVLEDKISVLELQQQTSAVHNGEGAKTAELQSKVSELQIKNTQLEDSLRQSQVRIGETAINTESKALKRIADLEVKLEAAKSDNTELAKNLEDMQSQQEDGRVNFVAGDWDLEQATKRFNESEREIRRLSLLVEQQKTVCSREKSKIEQMLFDPAVTDQKQQERLQSLEAQLEEAKAQLAGHRPSTSAMSSAPRSFDTSDASADVTDMPQAQADKEVFASRSVTKEPVPDLTEKASSSVEINQDALKPQDRVLPRAGSVSQDDKKTLSPPNKVSMAKPAPKPAPAPVQEMASIDAYAPADIEPAAGAMASLPPVPKDKPGFGKGNIQTLLQKAGLTGSQLKTSSAGWKGADNYAWSEGNIKGLASVKKMTGNFEAMVSQYIAYQQAQCGGGDFASMPSPTNGAQSMAMYEVACVGKSQSTSSSMVFFERDDKFIAISNQIGAEDMDMAMDSRDRIAGAVKKL